MKTAFEGFKLRIGVDFIQDNNNIPKNYAFIENVSDTNETALIYFKNKSQLVKKDNGDMCALENGRVIQIGTR